MKKTLEEFMRNEAHALVSNGKIDNEFGLQFELGCYLRKQGYDVYFEKNIKNKSTCKHEIDLVVEKENKKYAIELKFPKGENKGRKVTIYNFIKDIQFAEQLKELNFDGTYCVSMVDSDSYYEITGKEKNEHWKFFRGKVANGNVSAEKKLGGTITKWVKGKAADTYVLNKEHQIEWINIGGDLWAYIVEI